MYEDKLALTQKQKGESASISSRHSQFSVSMIASLGFPRLMREGTHALACLRGAPPSEVRREWCF
jgi:hypothetical protein